MQLAGFVVVCVWVGNKFPDVRWNERRTALEWDTPLEQWVGPRESQPILLLFDGLAFWL